MLVSHSTIAPSQRVAIPDRALRALGALAGVGLTWGLAEAAQPRLRELDVALPGLPRELDGVRIAHLSDFHFGVPSPGIGATWQAVEWVRERRPDLVAVTGDLLTHPRGEQMLRRLIRVLPQPIFAVLGNHDVAISRDPQAKASNLSELEPATLLRNEGRLVELRGRRIWIAGVDPYLVVRRKPRLDPNELAAPADVGADFSILLCHYPDGLDLLEPGRFDLVLAGHLHDGQICLPYPGGKLLLAHPTAKYTSGLYRTPAATMHVSPGLGTTFVPFRFASRPEATELVLRTADTLET